MIAPSTTPSSPGGSLNDGGFDSKIASLRVRLREEHVARLKEAMAGSIQEECKRHDDAIKSAWEAIEKAMETFKAHKHNLFEAMREDEGHARTQQAIESGGLDQITPTSYQMIVDRLALSDHKVKVLAHSRQPSPAVKERLPSPTLTPTSATAPPAKQFTAKRTRPQITLPQDPAAEPPSAKRARANADCESSTKTPSMKYCDNRDLASWEVEGKEYIFSHPLMSNAFYVLRCETSGIQHPHHTFKTHPFGDGSPALEHYNTARRCKGGHGADRTVSHDEIVKRWGYRVTGADVNKAWVDASNGQLEEAERGGSALRDTPAKRGGTIHVNRSSRN